MYLIYYQHKSGLNIYIRTFKNNVPVMTTDKAKAAKFKDLTAALTYLNNSKYQAIKIDRSSGMQEFPLPAAQTDKRCTD